MQNSIIIEALSRRHCRNILYFILISVWCIWYNKTSDSLLSYISSGDTLEQQSSTSFNSYPGEVSTSSVNTGDQIIKNDHDISTTIDQTSQKNSSKITMVDSHNTSNAKPKLVLHIGPRKTGTTTIQFKVLSPKKGLRSHLLKDNYQAIDYGYLTYRALLQKCFEVPQDECDESLWEELVQTYQAVYQEGNNALHSLEAMSKLPKNNRLKSLYQSFSSMWDVQVIIVYRPLDEWFPSMYAQHRKSFEMYRSEGGRWRYWPTKSKLKKYIGSFPQWMESIWNEHDLATIGDPYTSHQWWTDVYEPSSVTIINMMHPIEQDLDVEFVCQGLVNATHACAEARAKRDKRLENHKKLTVKNKSDFLMLDHDLLIIAAYERGILPSATQKVTSMALKKRLKQAISNDASSNRSWPIQRGELIPRHDATLLLESKLEEMNMTIQDLPRVCLSTDMEEKLADRTLLAEQIMEIHPQRSKSDITMAIRANSKLCSINVDEVLKQDMWLSFFSSTNFLITELEELLVVDDIE